MRPMAYVSIQLFSLHLVFKQKTYSKLNSDRILGISAILDTGFIRREISRISTYSKNWSIPMIPLLFQVFIGHWRIKNYLNDWIMDLEVIDQETADINDQEYLIKGYWIPRSLKWATTKILRLEQTDQKEGLAMQPELALINNNTKNKYSSQIQTQSKYQQLPNPINTLFYNQLNENHG